VNLPPVSFPNSPHIIVPIYLPLPRSTAELGAPKESEISNCTITYSLTLLFSKFLKGLESNLTFTKTGNNDDYDDVLDRPCLCRMWRQKDLSGGFWEMESSAE